MGREGGKREREGQRENRRGKEERGRERRREERRRKVFTPLPHFQQFGSFYPACPTHSNKLWFPEHPVSAPTTPFFSSPLFS